MNGQTDTRQGADRVGGRSYKHSGHNYALVPFTILYESDKLPMFVVCRMARQHVTQK